MTIEYYPFIYTSTNYPQKDRRRCEVVNEELSLNELELIGYNYFESVNLLNEIKKDKRLLQKL